MNVIKYNIEYDMEGESMEGPIKRKIIFSVDYSIDNAIHTTSNIRFFIDDSIKWLARIPIDSALNSTGKKMLIDSKNSKITTSQKDEVLKQLML